MIRSPKFLTFPNYIFDNFETHFGVSNFWGLPPSPPSKIRCLQKIRRKIGRCLIANCSAHRHPTQMSLYFLESSLVSKLSNIQLGKVKNFGDLIIHHYGVIKFFLQGRWNPPPPMANRVNLYDNQTMELLASIKWIDSVYKNIQVHFLETLEKFTI